MSLAAGRHLGRYEIRSQIGADQKGEVYLAHDPQRNRTVAIKILPRKGRSKVQTLRRTGKNYDA